ncbi:MAG: hypothetical protein ACXVP5_01320 [Tumebacillaceae bacterium]
MTWKKRNMFKVVVGFLFVVVVVFTNQHLADASKTPVSPQVEKQQEEQYKAEAIRLLPALEKSFQPVVALMSAPPQYDNEAWRAQLIKYTIDITSKKQEIRALHAPDNEAYRRFDRDFKKYAVDVNLTTDGLLDSLYGHSTSSKIASSFQRNRLWVKNESYNLDDEFEAIQLH